MSGNGHSLHGSAPDSSSVALLLIDVINGLEFPEADDLLRTALPMAQRLASFKRRVTAAGIPAIYVNDNFGRWRSDFRSIIEHCLSKNMPGRPIVELLAPQEEDYFVLKPKHSGFFSTALDILLEHLGVRTVIVTGIAGNICVLFTANDAYMRDYKLLVPRDCVASNSPEENDHAIREMQQVLKADVGPSDQIDLEALLAGHDRQQRATTTDDTAEVC